MFSSINKIDFSKYKTINIQIQDYVAQNNVSAYIGASHYNNAIVDYISYIGLRNGTVTLDVSNVNVSAYCKIDASLSGSTANPAKLQFKIKKIWLE